jgi:GNAT superfamily N-acetyltransferase
MTITPAGTEVAYTITYLEMTEPLKVAPALPGDVRLECCVQPPVWFFLSLYDAVGRMYEWVDKFAEDPEDLHDFVQHPEVALYVAYRHGWPAGFFQLDWRSPGVCDLAYFGLVPEAIGGGIGGSLLRTAIATGWERAGVRRMTVNTCTLDHPRALELYKRMGFSPVRTEDHTRVLTRDRDTSQFPA